LSGLEDPALAHCGRRAKGGGRSRETLISRRLWERALCGALCECVMT
jgi:hypothetical protein